MMYIVIISLEKSIECVVVAFFHILFLNVPSGREKFIFIKTVLLSINKKLTKFIKIKQHT